MTIIFGLYSLASAAQLVIVDGLGILPDAVRNKMEVHAGDIDRAAVGQVSAVGKIQSHDRVARLNEGDISGKIGLGAGMRLDIGMVGAKKLLGPLDRQRFRDINKLAPAVIAFARDSLRRTYWS